MPLSAASQAFIANYVPAGRHVIDNGAIGFPGAHAAYQNDSCESFAVGSLVAGAVLPSDLFTAVLIGPGAALGPTVGTPFAAQGVVIKAGIVAAFGSAGAGYNVGAIPPKTYNPLVSVRSDAKQLWNANIGVLHQWVATVFELALLMNNFVLAPGGSRYSVCMEYEASTAQDMFPNHTHAWLMFDDNRIIQKITGCHISVSRHHAGHQPHCGFVRRYVTDFSAAQHGHITGILANRHNAVPAVQPVTGCNLGVDITGSAPQPLDEQSPAI